MARKLTIHTAATQRNIPVIAEFLNSGTPVDERDQHGLTALYYTAYGGSVEATSFLLDHGAEIDSQGNSGRTPLSIASYHGHDEVVGFLLDRGAAIDLADGSGITPLSLAIRHSRHPSTVRLLVERGANVRLADHDGNTPLHAAVWVNNLAAAELLLQYGVEASTPNTEGKSALTVAMERGLTKMESLFRSNLPSSWNER